MNNIEIHFLPFLLNKNYLLIGLNSDELQKMKQMSPRSNSRSDLNLKFGNDTCEPDVLMIRCCVTEAASLWAGHAEWR